jgi:hypothetical protein
MPRYYVNKNAQSNGDHEVHKDVVCPTPADPVHRLYLGEFSVCHAAVKEAKKYFPQSNGCKNCSPECHTQ